MSSPSGVQKFGHPGKGRRKARYTGKGRQVEPAALEEVRALLGTAPRRRDLLIEHLHRIQDRYGHLPARHLAALASEMRLSMAEVHEVATFYAHFDVVAEGAAPPPPLTVRVCDSLTCECLGAPALLATLPGAVGAGVRVVRAPCMGRGEGAPVAEVGRRHVTHATRDAILACIEEGDFTPLVPPHVDFAGYTGNGGYSVLKECLSGARKAQDVIGALEDGGLKGMGGAGFPTGRKWRFVRAEPAPRLMAINADEGEPGTIKDRVYMERDPHRFLEGALIGGWAVEAAECYVYLRDEYPGIRKLLQAEIAKLDAAGLTGRTALILRRGAGAYICGEESAMLESIEGKRGEPRHKPPFPSQVGLWGRPTLVNNVETLHWVRDILERGPRWFADAGRNGRSGLRSFSVSGRVREPGVKCAPAGITMNELLAEHCGGMADGHRFRAYLPGGASGGILPASMADIPLDFGTLEAHGCFIGSAAVVVLSDKDDLKRAALNLMAFFEDESCGQCTPCRVGTEKAVALMDGGRWDPALLRELAAGMADASICGLGQAAPNPLLSVLRYFPEALS